MKQKLDCILREYLRFSLGLVSFPREKSNFLLGGINMIAIILGVQQAFPEKLLFSVSEPYSCLQLYLKFHIHSLLVFLTKV